MKRRQLKKNNLKLAQRYQRILEDKGFREKVRFETKVFKVLNGVEYGIRVDVDRSCVIIFPKLFEQCEFSYRQYIFKTILTKEFFEE